MLKVQGKVRHRAACACLALLLSTLGVNSTFADLKPAAVYTGQVGVSVSGLGGNRNPVGNLQAEIPAGSTILQAFFYAAGTPYPWYLNSPRTIADYNAAGIKIDGTPVTNFDTIVGATTTRADIGNFFTGRADVTALVQSKLGAGSSYSWSYTEGTKNNRIDGGVLAIIYSNPSLPMASVGFLDGGQKTNGEQMSVHLGQPLMDPNTPGFRANFGIATSFSTGGDQVTRIDINGQRLTSSAGGHENGGATDGTLLTVGGIGDSNANPANPMSATSPDDELYSLVPFLHEGDEMFTIYSKNASNDDNLFFMYIDITANIIEVGAPEPGSLGLLAVGGAGLLMRRRRK
jgi:hypothetical protein